MIYDYIVESANLLSEEILEEDKMVKYGGELAPKFGWCVIYVGGPGSGKGSATKFLSRLEGDYYNVDNLKEIERMWSVKDPNTGKPHSDNFKTPEGGRLPRLDKEGNIKLDKQGNPITYDKNRNMANSEFVSELHNEMHNLGGKWKKSILDNPENKEGRDRLPNIIFDITGDKVSKIDEIIDSLKPIGYKIAIIWVLSTAERAYRNNQNRDRKVNTDTVFLPKHLSVIEAMKEFFESGKISKVDEFWVIDAAIEINPSVDPVGYHNAQNVYHISTTPDGLMENPHVADRIKYNENEFKRLVDKRKENI